MDTANTDTELLNQPGDVEVRVAPSANGLNYEVLFNFGSGLELYKYASTKAQAEGFATAVCAELVVLGYNVERNDAEPLQSADFDNN
jgi:hypothetical protein